MTESSPLIGSLLRLAAQEDRAALAALRRGLGRAPGTVAEMYPYVEPYLGAESTRARSDAAYVVAALFASHPLNWHRDDDDPRSSNFGASFARLRARMASSEGAERRFTALLGAHREELEHHLRSAVSLLKSHDVPVDWEQLLRDIRWWGGDARRVERTWASAYWGTSEKQDSLGAEPATNNRTNASATEE
jgi:CRISPR system Cascade subunit CasB